LKDPPIFRKVWTKILKNAIIICMNTLRSGEFALRKTVLKVIIGLGGLSLLQACGGGGVEDFSKPNNRDLSFITASKSTHVRAGQMHEVPNVGEKYADEYDNFKEVDPRSFWGNSNNSIGYRPLRFTTSFNKGSGSGADFVCEQFGLPDDTLYINAVKNSKGEANISLNEAGNAAYICFDSHDEPEDVVAWASTEPL